MLEWRGGTAGPTEHRVGPQVLMYDLLCVHIGGWGGGGWAQIQGMLTPKVHFI